MRLSLRAIIMYVIKFFRVLSQNLNQNPRTLLPKFFGLYCYQVSIGCCVACHLNQLL